VVATLKERLLNNKLEILEHGLATCAAAVSRLSMFLIVLINTQFLSPQDFGLFTLLMLTSNIVNAFVSCGGDMWLNRFTRHYHSSKKRAPAVARFYLQISFGLAGIVGIVALCFGLFLRQSFEGQGLAIALSLIWAGSAGLIEAVLAILRTTNKIKRFFLIRDFVMPIILISAIFLLKIHTVSKFFMTASIIWIAVLLLLLIYIFRRSNLYFPRSILSWKTLGKGLISYTLKLILNNFSSRISNGFDALILAKYLPIDLVGKYRLGAQLANAFIVIQHFVFLALPWHLRATSSANEDHQGAKMVHARQIMLLLTALPALLILLFFAKPLLGLLGSGYQVIAIPICAFLLIRFSELLWGPQHEILISNNKIFADTVANLVGLGVGIIAFICAIQFLDPITSGVITAGLSSVVAQSIRFIALRISVDLRSHITAKKYLPWLPLLVTLSGVGYVAFS